MSLKYIGPKISIYLSWEEEAARKLNAEIDAGNTAAYSTLNRLAVRAVKHGRYYREEEP